MAGPQIEPGTIITGGEAPPWAPVGAPSPPAGQVFSGGEMPPWQQARASELEADAAGLTEAELSRPRVQYQARKTEDSWMNWGGRAVRAASFNTTDLVETLFVRAELRDEFPDLTYGETLAAVRQGYKDDPSMSAELVGLLVPGLGIAKGIGMAAKGVQSSQFALNAVTHSGMVRGAMRFVARNPKTGRVMQAMGAGATGGAVEESIRVGIDETIGIAAAEGFDGDRIQNAALTGALFGGIVGGGVQGAAEFVKRVAAGFNIGESQANFVGEKMYLALREGIETPDETVQRLVDDSNRFRSEHGFMPAMANLVPAEKVAEVADIARYYSGLDVTAKGYSDAGFDKFIQSYRRQVRGPGPLLPPELIQADASGMFNAVTTRFGTTPVAVSDAVLDTLDSVPGFVKGLDVIPGGKAIARVLDARQNIAGARLKLTSLASKSEVADIRAEVADLNVQIEQLLPTAQNPSQIQILMNLRDHLAKQASLLSTGDNATLAAQKLTNFRASVASMETAMDTYRNGLRITLSDANTIRSEASSWVQSSRINNPMDLPRARATNDAMRGVGVAEVPQYGEAVKAFREAMIRSEAQATGREAALGKLDAGTMSARIAQGRIPGRSQATSAGDVGALREGVREGAVREALQQAGGTPAQVLSSARKLSTAPNVQEGLRTAAPRDAARIERAASQLDAGADRMAAMAAPKSPTITTEQLDQMRNVATGALFGNIGGAARASLATWLFKKTTMSRGQAEKTLAALGDPRKFDDAVKYMGSKGADVGAFFGAMTAATIGKTNEQ